MSLHRSAWSESSELRMQDHRYPFPLRRFGLIRRGDRSSQPTNSPEFHRLRKLEMDSHTGASLRQLARIAGALYLINIVCGASPAGESVAAAAPGPGCHRRGCRVALRASSFPKPFVDHRAGGWEGGFGRPESRTRRCRALSGWCGSMYPPLGCRTIRPLSAPWSSRSRSACWRV